MSTFDRFLLCATFVVVCLLRTAAAGPDCGVFGYSDETNAYFYNHEQQYTTVPGCQQHCAADPLCQSMAVGNNTCLHFNVVVAVNFKSNRGSIYQFFDRVCFDPSATYPSLPPTTTISSTTTTLTTSTTVETGTTTIHNATTSAGHTSSNSVTGSGSSPVLTRTTLSSYGSGTATATSTLPDGSTAAITTPAQSTGGASQLSAFMISPVVAALVAYQLLL